MPEATSGQTRGLPSLQSDRYGDRASDPRAWMYGPGSSSIYGDGTGGAPGAGSYPGAAGGGMPGTAEMGAPGAGAAGGLPADLGGGAPSSGLGGYEGAAASAFNMIGDMSPLISIRQTTGTPQPPSLPPVNPPGPQPKPLPNVNHNYEPGVRGLKITENQSPIPQDRIFVDFNYFYNVNKSLNNHFQTPIQGINVWREIFGFEKTFNNGAGSIGLRLPLDTINAGSRTSRSGTLPVGGQSTSLGSLSIVAKHILWQDTEAGHLVSAGFAITPQTGPTRFAGANYLQPVNSTYFQPFLGYYFKFNRLYFHGFTALEAPTNAQLPTYWYNDLGLGYFLYQSQDRNQFLTAIVPTVEAHINNPLNHRHPYSPTDLFAAPDVVNITGGINFEMFGRAVLTTALVTPVTGPKPFDIEAIAFLNIRFGQRARAPIFPVIGQ